MLVYAGNAPLIPAYLLSLFIQVQTAVGWICTACFDRCKEEAEKLVVERNAVHRIPEAYERAIRSYSKLNLTWFDANQSRTRIESRVRRFLKRLK